MDIINSTALMAEGTVFRLPFVPRIFMVLMNRRSLFGILPRVLLMGFTREH